MGIPVSATVQEHVHERMLRIQTTARDSDRVPSQSINQLMTFNYIGMLNMTRYVGLFDLWWYGSILLTIIGLIIVAKDFIKKWITINNIR